MAKALIRLIELVTDAILLFLVLRVIMKLLGASTTAPFVNWLYQATEPFLTPFAGIFPNPILGPKLVLDVAAIFAIIAVAFIGHLISNLIRPKKDVLD